MSDSIPATEPTKTTIENSVSWYLADKMQDASTAIATKKYLTAANELIYLTRCNVAEPGIAKIKIQRFRRVDHGVQETGYQLFGDHRFVKYINEMIFGSKPDTASGNQTEDVSETEAAEVAALVNSLNTARQTL